MASKYKCNFCGAPIKSGEDKCGYCLAEISINFDKQNNQTNFLINKKLSSLKKNSQLNLTLKYKLNTLKKFFKNKFDSLKKVLLVSRKPANKSSIFSKIKKNTILKQRKFKNFFIFSSVSMLIILFSFERVNYLKISNLIQKTKDSLFNKNYLDSVSYFEKAKQIARNKNNLKKHFKEGQLSNLYINYGLLLIDRKEFSNAEKQFREAKYLSNEDEKIQIERFLHLIYVFQTKKCIESNERYRKIYCYQRPQFSRSRRYYLNTISRYSKSYPSYDLNKLNQLLISNNLKSLVQSCRNDIAPYYVDPRLNIFKGERFKELCIESKKLKTKKEYCDNPSFITPYFINKERIIINSKQSHPVVYERMCS